MRLRILLPPNLPASAPRDAIPVKLEIESNGAIRRPEVVSMAEYGELGDADRLAAFALLQWNQGSLASLIQLTRTQLAELATHLSGQPAFFWVNQPKTPIRWNGTLLDGVSSHIQTAAPAPAKEEPEPAAPVKREPPRTIAPNIAPPLIDGSTQYVSISLPSREHPYYDEIREIVLAAGFKLEPSNRKWWLRDRHKTLNFLGEYGGDFEERFQADYTSNFKQRAGSLLEAKVETEILEQRGGYDVNLTIKAGKASAQEINQTLNTGRHYIEAEGKVYLLKKSKLEKLRGLQQSLSDSPAAPLLCQGRYRVSNATAARVEEELAATDPNFQPPGTWRDRSAALRDLSKLPPVPLSESLAATLRPYQKLGASWLYHLFNHELGGILADEMGLGKTLQALALLSAIRRESNNRLPTLVICPASLVENWRREAKRFAPELTAFAHHGTNRIQIPEQFAAYDLVITSYGTLIRDEELFISQTFLCVIGDEAQHIKNRKTRNAQALASIQTRGRILLTGTPVENRIDDLNALLDFIMPGGWKPIPAGARGEERRWHEERIQKQAAPYILRRRKTEVAPELPEKIEHVIFLEMGDQQRAIYERTRKIAEQEISDLEKTNASEGSLRMKALTQLLRLRQVSCDPRLVDDKASAEDSAKLASFFELAEETIDGGGRILAFSQFVSILSLLREELEARGINYCYIDGSTKNRMAEVDRFNDSADIPLFLISLKAGGTGLNLTAADTVIHFDPWWNPAAEAQATDRAHRIGQTKVVTSYKLIVADTVEEKVLELQSSKRQLLENIFEASEAANASLSLADLKGLI